MAKMSHQLFQFYLDRSSVLHYVKPALEKYFVPIICRNYVDIMETIWRAMPFMEIIPGGGLDKSTDRDQRSWVFPNDPKNILPLTENPKQYFPQSKTLKIPSKTVFILQKSSMV